MKYALVQLPRESKKRVIVETCFIKNFETYNATTKCEVFHYDDGKDKLKCIILHVSDSEEELRNPQLRLRVPKLKNPSALESSFSEDEEVDLTKTKRSRKNKKQNTVASKKQRTDQIVLAHQFGSEINNTEKFDDHNTANSAEETMDSENDNIHKEINDVGNGEQLPENEKMDLQEKINNEGSTVIPETRERDLFELTDEDIGDIEGDDHNLHDGHSIPKITNTSKEKVSLEKKNENIIQAANKVTFDVEPETSKDGKSITTAVRDRGNKNIKIVNQQCIKLGMHENGLQQRNTSKSHPQLRQNQELRQQLDGEQALRQQEFERQRQHLRAEKQRRLLDIQQRRQQQQQLNNDNDYYLHNDQFRLGDNFFISSASFRDASSEDTPSRFVTAMAHAIWTSDLLATRVVRKQRNTGERDPLTPRKVELLSYHFEDFMRTRNFSEERIRIELKKLNTYLGRAITSAKKKNNTLIK